MQDDDWPEGWCGLAEGQAQAFLRQLAKELGPGHPLAPAITQGRVRAIGVAKGADDVVYSLEGERVPFVVVHLSWPGPDERIWLERMLTRRKHRPPAVVSLGSLSDLD